MFIDLVWVILGGDGSMYAGRKVLRHPQGSVVSAGGAGISAVSADTVVSSVCAHTCICCYIEVNCKTFKYE